MTTPGNATQPVHPLVWGAGVVFVAGLIGWLWTGHWQWAVTGALVACVVGAGANVRWRT
jgi:hypothetical protein